MANPLLPSIRTTTHCYPAEEEQAMRAFYGGKICAVEGGRAEWAHMLDAALTSFNTRLEWMLQRHLRQDRHPRHAAEVRENLLPLSPNRHNDIDSRPPFATLFLHEDLLARTLAFEIELQQWRCAEIEAGRGDPGRPVYEKVFEVHGVAGHRWHCAIGSYPFYRQGAGVYNPIDCPGVYSSSSHHFPVINTVLSIPFSLLSNISRLSSMIPLSDYQHDLLAMGHKIINLWSWDPPSTTDPTSTNHDAGGSIRTPAPPPIHDASRNNTTFESMWTQALYHSKTSAAHLPKNTSTPVDRVVELHSGGVYIGGQPSVSWESHIGLHLTVEGEDELEMHGKIWEGHSNPASLGDSVPSISESANGSPDRLEVEQPALFSSLSEIVSWLNTVTPVDEKMPWWTRGSFEKGTIRSMSVNDILMIKGLIDPGVYVEYTDLEPFSHY